ncbi:MAG TPA: hypothetical protein PLO51_05210 [Candidatus Micrarchaeota archaeon]|nr:hypothetical protein [Candidatus Micrarchaeota archaeon]
MTTITAANPAQNRNFYPPSLRPALVRGKEGAELFITLGTKNCGWGKCTFCGLGILDGKLPPLSVSEARGQMEVFFGKLPESERGKILKVSLISMSDSLLNPKTIEPEALIQIAKIIPDYLPNVVEASIESRADIMGRHVPWLKRLFVRRWNEAGNQALDMAKGFFGELSRGLKLPDLAKEIAVGIETTSDKIREMMNKGITNKQIIDAAKAIGRRGWNLRGYFIYNLLERSDNVGALERAVDFMARLGKKAKIEASILVLRGYVPEGRQNNRLFRGFADVPDEAALKELAMAARYAQKKGGKFEIDSTSEDQKATEAGMLSPAYTAALERYNLKSDPDELRLA